MMVFLVNVLLLWFLRVAEFSEIVQPVSVQTLQLGEPAAVECYIKSSMDKRFWYKLTTGRKLQLVAIFNTKYNRSEMSREFDHRYSVQFDKIKSRLRISRASRDDVGTYFCGALFVNDIRFGSGTFLTLKGVRISDSVIQQPESQSVQSGDSVTLSCSVHSGQCSPEHTEVLWLKTSHHSAPQMIYSGNQTCQRNQSSETTCESKLLMRNVNSEDAGTYYCVVTSCEQVLFGQGTKITNSEIGLLQQNPSVVLLILSNIIFGMVTLLLVWKLFKTQRKGCAEAPDRPDGDQMSDTVTYSAVSLPHRSLRSGPSTKNRKDSVVYSTIRS